MEVWTQLPNGFSVGSILMILLCTSKDWKLQISRQGVWSLTGRLEMVCWSPACSRACQILASPSMLSNGSKFALTEPEKTTGSYKYSFEVKLTRMWLTNSGIIVYFHGNNVDPHNIRSDIFKSYPLLSFRVESQFA